MPTNNGMDVDFANAAERAEFEKYRKQAADERRKQQEEAGGATPPAEPLKALEDRLGDEKKKGKFIEWLSRNSAVGAQGMKGLIDSFSGPINEVGGAVPLNPFGDNTAGGLKGTAAVGSAVGVDVATAITNPGNTAKQVPSGVLNAWNEINEFGASLDIMMADAIGYYPTLQIFDKQGNLDPRFLNLAEPDVQQRLREDKPLQIENKIEAPVSMTGALTQGISQFMAPYSAYNKAIKSAGLLAQPGYWNSLSRAALAGFAADFTAFDPELGRLTDMLDEMGLEGLAVEYLKSDPDDSEMEARFKTAIEGLGLGAMSEVLMGMMRSGRSIRQGKDEIQKRIDAMDRADADAKAQIDEDIRAFGDPDGEAIITEPPPRARTQADMDAARMRSREEMDADVRSLVDEYNRVRDEFGEELTPEQEDLLAGINDRIQTAVRRRDEADRRRMPTGEDQYLENDFFDIQARGVDDGGARFAMGDPPRNKERFLSEEVVARKGEQGDLVGFRTAAGDIGVTFDRFTTTTAIGWDWLDNIAAGTGYRPKNLTLTQANEVVSKVMAIVEADAKTSGTPTYYFEGRTEALNRIYTKLVPKLAERIGFNAEVTADGAILLTRKSVQPMIDTMRGLMAEPSVNTADRVARAQKRRQIQEEINRQSGFAPEFGRDTDRRAAVAMIEEIEARGAQFTTMDGSGRTERTFVQRMAHIQNLREEARRAFGKDFRMLEETGRIKWARRASDLDPAWRDVDDRVQAVTMPGGQVFIFTETTTVDDIYGIVLHEMGVHSGMRGMMGEDNFLRILDRVEELVDDADIRRAEWGDDALTADERLYMEASERARAALGDGASDRVKLLEETLAYLVQHAPHGEWYEEMIAGVKAWIVRKFPGMIERLSLNRHDFDALALAAIHSEALVAGRMVAMFGRGARMHDFGEFMQEPSSAHRKKTLGEEDRFDNQPEVRLKLNLTPDVPNDALSLQVREFQDDLLHGRVMDWMFRNVPDFDPFRWRDAVELVAQGQASREMYRMVRDGMRAFVDGDLGPNWVYRDFFEVSSPGAMRYWDAVRSKSDKPTTLVLPMEQRVFVPGSPDDAGFITTAERAIDSLGGQFADAESLTAEQWRKALRQNGVTGEAFRFQVEPALELIGRETGDITRDELKEAMARVRPDIQTKSGRVTADTRGPQQFDDVVDMARRAAPISNAIVEANNNYLLEKLPRALRDRLVDWAEQNVEDAVARAEEGAGQIRGMGEQDYSDYVSPGRVEGYEQELIIAPDAAKGYRSHNWETDGVIGHIRTTDRRTAKGEKVVFVDELQSDLHQDAVKFGYDGQQGKLDPRLKTQAEDAMNEAYTTLSEELRFAGKTLADLEREVAEGAADQGLVGLWDSYKEAERAYDAALEATKGVTGQPPRAPMKDWEKPFIRRVLQKAAQRRVSLVAFTNFDTLNDALRNDGTKKFYDDRLPAHIKAVAQELGLKVEQVELSFGRDGIDGVGTHKVAAIRLTPKAMDDLAGGVPMFSMRDAPGRMDRQLENVVLNDIKEGRRGLSADEREALLGAAERWAAAVARQQPQRERELADIIEVARTRADPQAIRDLIEMMEMAKTEVPEPVSLLKFLRRQGGLKDMDGELSARDFGYVNLLNNRSGRTLDDAALNAQEAGYLGEYLETGQRATIDDLLEAIDRELRGEKVYSYNDIDWVMEAATREDMRRALRELGLDPKDSRKTMMSEYERIAAIQEGEPLTLKDFEDLDVMERQAGAKPGIGLPERGLLGGNEIRINFNAIQTADDIRSVMGQLADAFASEVQAARGGSRPNKVVIKDAKRQSGWDALNERREGTPLTDSQVLAAQSLYVASAENVKAALDQAMRTGSDMAHYNARRAMTLHRAIQAEIAGAKADASRALRAWSIPRASTAQARRELNQVLEEYGGRLDPEDAARLRTMLDTDPAAADKAIRSLNSRVADIGGAVLRFAWLSGPHTHVMNMAGNSLTMAYDIGIRMASGVRGKILGDPVLERELSIAIAEYAGLMAGIRAQFSGFAKKADYGRMGKRLQEAQQAMRQGDYRRGLMTGASALAMDNPVSATFRGRFDDRGVSGAGKYAPQGNERPVSAEAFGMKQGTAQAAMVNGVGRLLSAPTDFLGFQDDFFKGINELAARYREAQRIVLEEMQQGLKREDAKLRFAELVDNPPREVLEEARRTAQRRTFTEPVGEGTRTLLKARNILNKLGFPLGHLLLPFVVTPSNILKFAFQNGPTGILFREMREELAAGGTRAALAQSRMLAGTALLIIGADMVANGHATGRAPTDTGERELWERAGKQEYSIRVGDKWVSYRRMEPISTMMAIGADLQNIMLNTELNDDPNEDFGELLGPVIGAAIQVVTSKTYLTSASEFIRFTEDPDRYGAGYLERLLSSVLAPAGLSQIEEIQDPVIREASNVMERWMARTPGYSKDLPPSYDIWGRKRSVSSGLGHVYDALSPFTVKTQDPEPIDKELLRIGFYPRRPDKAITVQTPLGLNVSVNLRNRPDIWTRYIQLAGNEMKIYDGMGTKDYLNAVIDKRHPDSAEYFMLPDSATGPVSKEWFINKRINQARTVARVQLQREFRADLQAMATAALEAERAAELRREALAPQ